MINSYSELQKWISKLRGNSNVKGVIGPKDIIWWRGHAKQTWQLKPGIFRSNTHIKLETDLFHNFRLQAKFRHNYTPDENDDKSWLSLMQHYGLPTRLLDWSESVLVALFFVCEKEHEKSTGVLWALKPKKLNESQINSPKILRDNAPAVKEPLIYSFFVISTSGRNLYDVEFL